jgi:hypothetical protein
VIEDGGIPAFLSLCNSPDLMSQYYVGCALANLSCSVTNHPIIVEAGGLQVIKYKLKKQFNSKIKNRQ